MIVHQSTLDRVRTAIRSGNAFHTDYDPSCQQWQRNKAAVDRPITKLSLGISVQDCHRASAAVALSTTFFRTGPPTAPQKPRSVRFGEQPSTFTDTPFSTNSNDSEDFPDSLC